MHAFLLSRRSKVILGIDIFAIFISAISKKFISYPTGGCMNGAQEFTFNKEINCSFFEAIRKG